MGLIPLKDSNPLHRIAFPYVTVALIAICVLVFLWQQSLGSQGDGVVYGLGMTPAVLTGAAHLPPSLMLVPPELTLITCMFLHGGWMHLIGNMLFLWIFGDNVEDSMGHVRFLIFYLLTGVAASIAQIVADPGSTGPTIGASGAVSGVLGGYIVLHPRAPVWVLVLRFPVKLRAMIVIGGWIALQIFSAVQAAMSGDAGGVAWWAHIGGFIAGCVLIVPFRDRRLPLFDRGRDRTTLQRPPPLPRNARSVFPPSRRR